MLEPKQMFDTAMDRLATIYANEPAKLEAMNLTKEIALESFGDVQKLSGPIGTSTIDTKPSRPQNYKNAPGVASTKSEKPGARVLAIAMGYVIKWAKSDPVGCKKWVNSALLPAIDNSASYQFGNLSDNWKQMFDDEVSGKNDQVRADVAKKLDADKKKKEAAAAKHQAHVDALKKMDEEDAAYEKERERLANNGNSAEIYGDTKKRGLIDKFGRGLKRMWHSLHEAAEQAIKDGDMAKLESIKAQMTEMKSLLEAAGMDFEKVIVG